MYTHSDLSNGFKRHVNELKLRRHGITNQNMFRCSGRADETKRERNFTVITDLCAFKATKLDRDSTALNSTQSFRQ